MIAFSPPQLLPNYACSLQDPFSHDQNSIFVSKVPQTSHLLPFSHHITPPFQQNTALTHHHYCEYSPMHNLTDQDLVKKLHHNATERHRRKKINHLYSSLRSLLPSVDQTKKLSIPATVSRVVTYIPELQQQVKRLAQKKEELLLKTSSQDDLIYQQNLKKSMVNEAPGAVSANRVGDREVVVQICNYKNHKTQLSSILLYLEDEGFVLLNSSSFETSGDRIFYSLHFQVETAFGNVEFGDLSRKIASLYDIKGDFFR